MRAIRRDSRIDWLRLNRSLGFAVGDVFGAGVGGVGEGDFASVGGLDDVVGHDPVFCVGDGSGGGGFDVEVVDFEVNERGVGVGAYAEGLFGSCRFDIPDVDVGEVGKALFFGDRSGERDPIGWDGLGIGAFGQFGVAVGGVPVHSDGDGNGDACEGEVVDADVRGVAAADMSGLEENTVGHAGFCGYVPGFDVVEAAGGFAADGDGCGSVVDDGVVDFDVLGGAVVAETVGVAAGFVGEGVVVDVDVGVGDIDVAGGVDVDAVGGGTVAVFVVANNESVDVDVVGVEDLDGPEAGAPKGEACSVVDVVGVLDERESNTLGVVIGGPAESFGLIDLENVAEDLPPDGAVAVDGALAGDGDVMLVADVDHGGRPGHLDAGDAGGEFGEVFDVL